MIKKILNAKNWQLFLLAYGIPIILIILLIISVLIRVTYTNGFPPANSFFERYNWLFPFIALFSSFILLIWLWAVGVSLSKILTDKFLISLRRFRCAWCYLFVYAVFAMIYIGLTFWSGDSGKLGYLEGGGMDLYLMSALHLLAFLATSYCIYFIAKVFRSLELGREAHFADFIKEFALLWIFPIGVWFIQPKINFFASKFKDWI